MEKIAITFRDFTAHLIPGILYISIWFYVFPEWLTLIEGKEVLFSVFSIFVAYAVGFLADTIFFPRFNKIIRFIPWFSDPMSIYFTGILEGKPKTLKSLAYSLMKEHLSSEVVENAKSTVLIYTAVRYIELKNLNAANILARIHSLGNLSISMVPPLLLFSTVAALHQQFLIASGAIILAYFCLRKNRFYRSWLARTAVRHYILLRSDSPTLEAFRSEPFRAMVKAGLDRRGWSV